MALRFRRRLLLAPVRLARVLQKRKKRVSRLSFQFPFTFHLSGFSCRSVQKSWASDWKPPLLSQVTDSPWKRVFKLSHVQHDAMAWVLCTRIPGIEACAHGLSTIRLVHSPRSNSVHALSSMSKKEDDLRLTQGGTVTDCNLVGTCLLIS